MTPRLLIDDESAMLVPATLMFLIFFVHRGFAQLNWMASDLDGLSARLLCDSQLYNASVH